jgi:hypothetical protein
MKIIAVSIDTQYTTKTALSQPVILQASARAGSGILSHFSDQPKQLLSDHAAYAVSDILGLVPRKISSKTPSQQPIVQIEE